MWHDANVLVVSGPVGADWGRGQPYLQGVKVAQALIHDPQVLLFDEPLAVIDPGGRVELMALFRELARAGRTVLISTHVLHEV